MIRLTDITLRIAGRTLLEKASAQLPAGHRYGLVGRNGTGKTTLLKLLSGAIQVDSGEVSLPSRASIGEIAQEAPGGQTTPLQAVLRADRERTRLLAEAEGAEDAHRIAEIQTRLADIDAHIAEARAAKFLKGLGFDEEAQAQPLSSFSGGWRMRVALGGLLFVEPALLLLDEPTNHLDLEASMWLENHLPRYRHTLILVSHDRDLLNGVPDHILHLSGKGLKLYRGNYDRFERTRREQIELEQKMAARQEAKRKHMQAFVDRFRYKASKARQAQSRLKAIERMGPISATLLEPEIAFRFPETEVPPPPMLTLDRVDVGYGDKPVLRGLNLRIDPDDRIALLGANGNGKSTFAKLVARRLEAMAGETTRARNLRVGFFAQHQIEDLVPSQSPLDHLRRLQPGKREQDHRSLLAQFGLDADRAGTPSEKLSGGEKTRLALCLMCLDTPQILILDEPTNHLDIDSREALVEALNDYPGAVLIISHDRHLVELTADRLWLVADGSVEPFDGDVAAYRNQLLRSANGSKKVQNAAPAERVDAGERRAKLAPLRKAAKDAERRMQNLTAEKSLLDARLADPKTYSNAAKAAEIGARLQELQAQIETAETAWLEAEHEIEALS
ncbi:MAG: ABC-F family ATP-binding cassette domain-containing protein [Geminicoccaceae bacterium]